MTVASKNTFVRKGHPQASFGTQSQEQSMHISRGQSATTIGMRRMLNVKNMEPD